MMSSTTIPHTLPPNRSSNPATPTKRRFDPKGILLGTWKGSGLHAGHANAVFGSRDVYDRINRRISKESMSNLPVFRGDI